MVEGRGFRFQDVGEVRTSLARISQENLRETTVEIEGAFLGVLPIHRTFEFQRAGTGEVVSGKVGAELAVPAAINAHLGAPARIRVTETTVGSGKPRYVLLPDPEWIATPQSS